MSVNYYIRCFISRAPYVMDSHGAPASWPNVKEAQAAALEAGLRHEQFAIVAGPLPEILPEVLS